MNEMTSLLISSVAAAFVAGAMAIPITMPDAAFAATKPQQGEEVCPAPAPEELAETDGEITVQPVHVRPDEELQPDLPRPGICVLRIGLSDTRCCPD